MLPREPPVFKCFSSLFLAENPLVVCALGRFIVPLPVLRFLLYVFPILFLDKISIDFSAFQSEWIEGILGADEFPLNPPKLKRQKKSSARSVPACILNSERGQANRMKEQVEAVRRMQEYIETHLCEEITPANLAAASHYSPWHAYRLFTQFLGRTP